MDNEKETQSTDKAKIDVELLESLVGYNLRRAAARQRERFRSVFDAYNIRPVLLTALTVIRDNMPLRQADLGRALEIKRANVVTLLTELEDRGLIVREPSARDRRSQVISLTDAGRKSTDQLLSVHAKLEADLARSFGKRELEELVRLLKAFRSVDAAPRLD
ncbi:MAG: MarR family transcriptional regulator [Gammaproteobacteria bacterium]